MDDVGEQVTSIDEILLLYQSWICQGIRGVNPPGDIAEPLVKTSKTVKGVASEVVNPPADSSLGFWYSDPRLLTVYVLSTSLQCTNI